MVFQRLDDRRIRIAGKHGGRIGFELRSDAIKLARFGFVESCDDWPLVWRDAHKAFGFQLPEAFSYRAAANFEHLAQFTLCQSASRLELAFSDGRAQDICDLLAQRIKDGKFDNALVHGFTYSPNTWSLSTSSTVRLTELCNRILSDKKMKDLNLS